MNKVWLLLHAYEYYGQEEIKNLGIYSTKELAETAKARYFQQPGFRDYPEHCFYIQPYTVDMDDAWSEGFFRTDGDTAYAAFTELTENMNRWLGIRKSAKESWGDADYYEALTEISWKLSCSDDPKDIAEYIRRMLDGYAGISKDFDACRRMAEQLLEIE